LVSSSRLQEHWSQAQRQSANTSVLAGSRSMAGGAQWHSP
jgi:hypothetical protein